MGWEIRKGRRYLYVKERVGDRVVSHYLGRASVLGELADYSITAQQAQQRERAQFRQERRWMDFLAAILANYEQGVEVMARTSLEHAGFHRHARGPWRKRRKDGKHGEQENGCAKR